VGKAVLLGCGLERSRRGAVAPARVDEEDQDFLGGDRYGSRVAGPGADAAPATAPGAACRPRRRRLLRSPRSRRVRRCLLGIKGKGSPGPLRRCDGGV